MLTPIHRKVSLVLIALAIFYLYLAYQLPSFMNSVIDADTMPKIMGYLLILLSILLFFTKSNETQEDKEKRKIARPDLIKILGVVLMILGYIFFLERLGFVLVSVLFTFFCSLFLGYKNHLVNVLVSVLFPVALYSAFTMLLRINLPSGIIPF